MVVLRLFLIFALCFFSAWAQNNTPPPAPATGAGIWRADLPGGAYLVRLANISSVSQHEYIVGGTMKVSEVNVVTSGYALARFYVIEPFVPETPGSVGQSLLDSASASLKEASDSLGLSSTLNRVTKVYPTTTHAHTIEYRLETREGLNKLFASISKAWTSGRGENFRQ